MVLRIFPSKLVRDIGLSFFLVLSLSGFGVMVKRHLKNEDVLLHLLCF